VDGAGSENIIMCLRTIDCENRSGCSWLRKYYIGDKDNML
jgi:hypothetical protein